MTAAARSFTADPGVRKAVGLVIGLVGPSSSGKTYSALRLSSGIRDVTGGEIDFIDTENGRALYYADKFRFNHVKLSQPFSPSDYLAALEYCVKRGTKTIVIDSMSHEHEGKGGVLDWHEQECERLIKAWSRNGNTVTRDTVQLAAWKAPKDARTELILAMLQMNVNLVMTYRAKEKIKIVTGKKPVDLGWQPIAGEQYIYEMVLQVLLPPNSEGVPVWQSDNPNELAIMKRPAQFHALFDRNNPKQLDEETGRKLAEWAAGTNPNAGRQHELGMTDTQILLRRYSECMTKEMFETLEEQRGSVWKKIPTADKPSIKEASEAAKRRLSSQLESISLDQSNVLADALKEEGVALSLFLGKFEIGAIEELPAAKYEEAKAFIDETSEG